MLSPDFDPKRTVSDSWSKRLLIGLVVGCISGFVVGFFSGGVLAAVAFGPCLGLVIGAVSATCPKHYFEVFLWLYFRLF